MQIYWYNRIILEEEFLGQRVYTFITDMVKFFSVESVSIYTPTNNVLIVVVPPQWSMQVFYFCQFNRQKVTSHCTVIYKFLLMNDTGHLFISLRVTSISYNLPVYRIFSFFLLFYRMYIRKLWSFFCN